MILATQAEERRQALSELEVFQREDFLGLFKEMAGLPVTIRLLDPPLHEFLPNRSKIQDEIFDLQKRGSSGDQLEAKLRLLKQVDALHEVNPMMGLRGCRLGITKPEINEMQVRAIFEAACDAADQGLQVLPEIMIPLVGHVVELAVSKQQLELVAKMVLDRRGRAIAYRFGTMIEIPRAALIADQLALEAEFFSFGTNDLTQMTWGFSRDDAERSFLYFYLENKILKANPFETLDIEGVGALMQMAIAKGRAINPSIKLGICGEHGGDPASIAFSHQIGLDYVSCSPFRLPVARLAAAHAALAMGGT
jgi:pyruvate,orthophosphate dikinase